MSIEPTDVSLPQGKPENSAAGCRMLANDDRIRAQDSDSAHMRFRLACSAEAWTARAEMLDRMEANRIQMNNEGPPPEARDGRNDNG